MTLGGGKRHVELLHEVPCSNLHDGRFGAAVDAIVALRKRQRRLKVVVFDRSIFLYKFLQRTDWVLSRAGLRLHRRHDVFSLVCVDSKKKTIVKVRHTGNRAKDMVDGIDAYAGVLGPDHPLVRALNCAIRRDVFEAAARVRDGSGLASKPSKLCSASSKPPDYEKWRRWGFQVVPQGDAKALVACLMDRSGPGAIVMDQGDADLSIILGALILQATDTGAVICSDDLDFTVFGETIQHERTKDRVVLYSSRYEGNEWARMLFRALMFLGQNDCMKSNAPSSV